MQIQKYYNPITSLVNWVDTEMEELNPNIITIHHKDYEKFMKDWGEANIFALDIETYSYNPKTGEPYPYGGLDPWMNDIRLIQIGLRNGKVLIIDTGGYIKPQLSEADARKIQSFWKLLKKQLASPQVVVLGHNLKFDLLHLRILGLKAFRTRDTMLMSEILWSGIGVDKAVKGEARLNRGIKGFHSLKLVAQRCGINDVDKTEQTSDWGATLLTNSQYNYAAKDVSLLFPVHDSLIQLIQKDKEEQEALGKPSIELSIHAECKGLPAFVEMEYKGFPVVKEVLEKTLSDYLLAREVILKPWKDTFKDASPRLTKKDLVPLFKKVLNITVNDTSSEALATIDHPAIQSLLTYRTLEISIKYLERVKEICETSENSGLGYVARSKFRQIATNWRTASSGKISYTVNGTRKSTNSVLCHNLQQMPKLSPDLEKLGLKSIRCIFGVPKTVTRNELDFSVPQSLIIADLSQAHTRIAAEMMDDKTLIKSYNEGLDNHLITAQKVLKMKGLDWTFESINKMFSEFKKDKGVSAGVEKEGKLIKQARNEAKTGFYAFLNQAGAKTMASTFAGYGIEVTEEFCKELIDILRSTYSGLYQGIKKHIREANSYNLTFSDYVDLEGNAVQGEYGVIRSLSGGRNYCKKVEFKDPHNKTTRKDVPFTDTISFMWLATEATVMKMALGRLYEEFHNHPEWGAYLCNFTHDEVNIICNQFKDDTNLIYDSWEWEFETKEDLGETLGILKTDVCAVCHENVSEQVANIVGRIIKEEMERYIKKIPVEESSNYSEMICTNYSQK